MKNMPDSSSVIEVDATESDTESDAVQELRSRRMGHLLNGAGVPPRYRMAHFENCERYREMAGKKKALLAAEEMSSAGYIDQRGFHRFCLLIVGDFGTGKTWLATALFKDLLWRHAITKATGACLWRKFHAFIREVQNTYEDGGTFAAIQRFQTCPVLMLDDIGDLSRRESDNRQQLLFEVIDYRNDYLLPTVLTTNLDTGGLAEGFGERTFQRMLEMSAMVAMDGDNMRMRKIK